MITIERAQDRSYYVRGMNAEQSVLAFVEKNPGCSRIEAGRVKRHYRLGVNSGHDLVTRMIASGQLRVESRVGVTYTNDGQGGSDGGRPNGQFTDHVFLGDAR